MKAGTYRGYGENNNMENQRIKLSIISPMQNPGL